MQLTPERAGEFDVGVADFVGTIEAFADAAEAADGEFGGAARRGLICKSFANRA